MIEENKSLKCSEVKFKTFSCNRYGDLEEMLNCWTDKHPNDEFIDIKYSSFGTSNRVYFFTAVIVYKVHKK